MFLKVVDRMVTINSTVISNAERKAFMEALDNYRQAEHNFNYAENEYIDKATYDLKSAEVGLSKTLQRIRGDRFERNKLAYSKSN